MLQQNYAGAERALQAVACGGAEEIHISNELGHLYQMVGNYSRAEWFFLRAAGAWERTFPGSNAGLVRILNNLATLYLGGSQFGKAERACRRASAFCETEEVGLPDRARLMGNWGGIYCAQGKYEEAEAACRRAIDLWQRIGGASAEIAALWHNLGLLHVLRKRWDAAIGDLERSVACLRSQSGRGGEISPLLNTLGGALMETGRLHEAERVFQDALSGADDLPPGRRAFLPELLTNYAELMRRTNRPREAKAFRARAEAVRRDLGQRDFTRHAVDVGELAVKK
jgi:tetratricopeptide (TPR) repeat protein